MLIRFDPFRELDRLADLGPRTAPTSLLAMDAYRRGDDFVVQFDLPGADPASIDLSVERNVLTVTAERPAAGREQADRVIVTERRHGRFTRRLFLGEAVDTDRITAAYDNGVLTITVPVSQKAQPRRIAIGGGSPASEPVAA